MRDIVGNILRILYENRRYYRSDAKGLVIILGINSFVIRVIQLRVLNIFNWSDKLLESIGSNRH
jgi:hypothetical protein